MFWVTRVIQVIAAKNKIKSKGKPQTKAAKSISMTSLEFKPIPVCFPAGPTVAQTSNVVS